LKAHFKKVDIFYGAWLQSRTCGARNYIGKNVANLQLKFPWYFY